MKIFYKSELKTFLGKIILFFDKKQGLFRVFLNSNFDKECGIKKFQHNIKFSNDNIYLTQLKEYFDANRKEFDFPFILSGTEFQKDVWRFVSKIPFGKTVSYSDVANKIGHKSAQRAIGSALGRNPLPIVIPCHRVIKSDGTLGGFTGGIGLKKKLLKFEKISI